MNEDINDQSLAMEMSQSFFLNFEHTWHYNIINETWNVEK